MVSPRIPRTSMHAHTHTLAFRRTTCLIALFITTFCKRSRDRENDEPDRESSSHISRRKKKSLLGGRCSYREGTCVKKERERDLPTGIPHLSSVGPSLSSLFFFFPPAISRWYFPLYSASSLARSAKKTAKGLTLFLSLSRFLFLSHFSQLGCIPPTS